MNSLIVETYDTKRTVIFRRHAYDTKRRNVEVEILVIDDEGNVVHEDSARWLDLCFMSPSNNGLRDGVGLIRAWVHHLLVVTEGKRR